MAIVTAYDWESDTWTTNGDTPTRQAWRQAVAEIAEKAKAKLPECSGRVDSAVKIVLADDVELLADGTAKVAARVTARPPTMSSIASAPVRTLPRLRTSSASIVSLRRLPGEPRS